MHTLRDLLLQLSMLPFYILQICDNHTEYKYGCFIVQIIFSFWSFEIREDILRNHKIIIGLDSYSNQRSIYLAPF